jgi:hypothetical protein
MAHISLLSLGGASTLPLNLLLALLTLPLPFCQTQSHLHPPKVLTRPPQVDHHLLNQRRTILGSSTTYWCCYCRRWGDSGSHALLDRLGLRVRLRCWGPSLPSWR